MEDTADNQGAAMEPEGAPAPEAGNEPAAASVPAERFEQAMAELEAARAHIGKLNEEAAKNRRKAKEAQAAEAQAAAEAGDLRPMVETLNGRLAELEPAAQKAQRLEEYLEAQVEARAKALPKEWQSRLERFADPVERLDLIELYEQTVGQAKAPAAPAPREASAPAGPDSTGTDWDSLVLQGGSALARAKAADPDGFAAYESEALGRNGRSGGNSLFAAFRGK